MAILCISCISGAVRHFIEIGNHQLELQDSGLSVVALQQALAFLVANLSLDVGERVVSFTRQVQDWHLMNRQLRAEM